MSTATIRSGYLSQLPTERQATDQLSSSESVHSQNLTGTSMQFKKPASRHAIEMARKSTDGDTRAQMESVVELDRDSDRLLNARQVANRLGVSERFIRDHTTRRLPKIPALKLGKLIRYRRADVDLFMSELMTLSPSRRSRIDV